MTKSSPLASKLSTWILMLLVWNIALLSIALYFLIRIVQHPPSSENIAQTCAEAISSALPPSL